MLRQVEDAPATVGASNFAKTETSVPSPPFTAEEIAHAIAELEKERSLKEFAQGDAAQISDILEQLHLDLTPSEVSAKIEQERRAHIRKKQVQRERLFLTGITGIVFCLLAVVFLMVHRITTHASPPQPVAVTRVARVATKPISPSELTVVDSSGGQQVRKTLAEVPEGVRVQLPADQLKMFLGSASDSVPVNMFLAENEWQVFRKEGTYYLRGYTGVRISRKALLLEPVIHISNIKDVGGLYYPMPVIVPLSGITLDDSDILTGSYSSRYQTLTVRLKNVDDAVFGK